MNIDANELLLSLLVSSVGFVCFSYGKRQGRLPQVAAGVLLMGYPYFVSNALAVGAIAVGILGAMWIALRLGV